MGDFADSSTRLPGAASACKSSLVNTIFAMSNTLQQQDFSVQKPESTRDSTPKLVQTCTLGPLLVAADVTSISTDFSDYRAQHLEFQSVIGSGNFRNFRRVLATAAPRPAPEHRNEPRGGSGAFPNFQELPDPRRELPETAVRSHLQHLMRHCDCA